MHYFGTSLEDDYLGHSPTLEFSRLESYTCQNLTSSFLLFLKYFKGLWMAVRGGLL